MTLTFGSLFAGVGGFDLGFEAAGMECRWQVEWDDRCQQVLAHHWPTVERHGDVRDVDGRTLPPVDVITFGSPCQDLSVAGKRAGLDGERSGLFMEAIRIIREMREATDGRYPAWAVWENVGGALSSAGGRDFARVLDLLADAGALVVEWAVLDARWFGVPQRRRRVFVVACFHPATAAHCPDPLLPVGPRRAGDPEPGAAAGQGSAAGAPRRSDKHRRDEFVGSLTSMDGWERPDNAHAEAGWLVPVVSPAVTAKWAKGNGGPAGDECQNLVVGVAQNQRGEVVLTDYAHQLTTGGGKPGEGYAAVMVPNDPLCPTCLGNGYICPDPDDCENTSVHCPACGGTGEAPAPITFALQPDDREGGKGALRAVFTDIAPTVTGGDIHSDRGLRVAYPLAMRGRDGEPQLEMGEPDIYNALRSSIRQNAVLAPVHAATHAVRRLTPLECERLMGWPDDHTRYGALPDGATVEIADSHRYRMCGNGVVAVVAEWIGRQIVLCHTTTPEAHP